MKTASPASKTVQKPLKNSSTAGDIAVSDNPYQAACKAVELLVATQRHEKDELTAKIKGIVGNVAFSNPPGDSGFFKQARQSIMEETGIVISSITGGKYTAKYQFENMAEMRNAFTLVNMSGGIDPNSTSYTLRQTKQWCVESLLREREKPTTLFGGVVKSLDEKCNAKHLYNESRSIFMEKKDDKLLYLTAPGHFLNGKAPANPHLLKPSEFHWLLNHSVAVGAAVSTSNQAKRLPKAMAILQAQVAGTEIGFVVDTLDFDVERFDTDKSEEKMFWLRIQSRPFTPLPASLAD